MTYQQMYAEAWQWLTAEGIIRHAFGCDCITCEMHIDRYFS